MRAAAGATWVAACLRAARGFSAPRSRWRSPLVSRSLLLAGPAALAAWTGACGSHATPAPPVKPADLGSPEIQAVVERAFQRAERQPEASLAWAELGLAFEANGRFEEAVVPYERAHALDPEEPLWPLHAALCETEAGLLDQARARLEASYRVHDRFAPLVHRLALARWESGDFAGARQAYERLSNLPGGGPAGLTGLAEVELASGRPEQALSLSRRALAAQPDGEPQDELRLARFLGATALRELGLLAEARAEFAAAGEPRRHLVGDSWSARTQEFAVTFEARFAAATGLLDGGRIAEARGILEQLALERPREVRALGNLAMARAAGGELAGALEVCDRALTLEPDAGALHVARAKILLGLGRAGDASIAARRATDIEPHVATHFLLLSHALEASGDPKGARAALLEARRLAPAQPAERPLDQPRGER